MSKLFRQAREEQGKDIKTIAELTRIKESCLRAIEDEDYDKLPIEVYTRGYIREYARYLGLQGDPGIAPYEKYLASKLKKTADSSDVRSNTVDKGTCSLEKQESTYCKEVKTTSEMRQTEKAPLAGLSRFIWKGVLLLIVAAAVIYQFVSSRNAEKIVYVPPPTPQEQIQKESTQPEAPLTQSPGTQATGEKAMPQDSTGTHKKHVLEIAADDTAWVQVVSDGRTKREALMKRGDSATYEADDSIGLVVGNAGGVTMKFDGRELPPGKKGEVLRLSLPEKKALAHRAGPEAGEIPKESDTTSLPGKPESSRP